MGTGHIESMVSSIFFYFVLALCAIMVYTISMKRKQCEQCNRWFNDTAYTRACACDKCCPQCCERSQPCDGPLNNIGSDDATVLENKDEQLDNYNQTDCAGIHSPVVSPSKPVSGLTAIRGVIVGVRDQGQ